MNQSADTKGHRGLSREQLDGIVNDPDLPEHFKSIYAAIRDYHIHHLLLMQKEKSFSTEEINKFGPTLAIIGDDTDRAIGPSGFDQTALTVLIGKSACIAIIASQIVPDIYKCLSLMTGLLRINTIIIETRPEQEMAWRNYVHGISPDASILHGMAGQ